MKNQYIDIIMFAMSSFTDWAQGFQNRNFHVLNTLQKDSRVRKILVVDFLPFTFKKAVKTYLFDIILNKHGGDIIYGDLTSECHQHTSKIYNYASVDSIISEKIIIKEIKKICKILEMDNIVLWSYNPMFISSFGKLNERLTVFDAVDNWLTHSSYQKHIPRLKKNYKEISKKTDIIFTVAQNLVEFFAELGRKKPSYFYANGINISDFDTMKIFHPRKVDFFENNKLTTKKIIGYIGTMQADRFDIDLMEYVIRSHPDKNFILAGPIWKEFENEVNEKIKKYPNVFFPGRVKREDWIDYCSYFDVAINPHKLSEFISYTSPTKVFEYFTCGKPVVSTKVTGIDEFEGLIHIARNKEEFSKMINAAIKENTKEKNEKRTEYGITNFTWDMRVGQMLDIVFKKLDENSK